MGTHTYDFIERYRAGNEFPKSINPDLMPEWDIDGGMSFRDAMQEIESYCDKIHEYMKKDRAMLEDRWKLCREYYNMDAKLKQDKERLASIFAHTEQVTDRELDLERSSLVHPIIFEAVQQQQARLVDQIFGSGPKYVEVLGRERNDVKAAEIYEEIANYQQEWQIPTEDIADDLVNGGLVEGTGLVARQWDFKRNCPDDECLNVLDYWFDPQGPYHHRDRWNVWRRYVTLGEMLMLRQSGFFDFDDKDMEGALSRTVDTRARDYTKGEPRVSPKRNMSMTPLDLQSNRHHELVVLDIFMQQEGVERWVYRANKLIVGIHENPVPKEEGIFRFPVAIYTPIRKKNAKYGDSAVYRMLDSQDIVNSISYMMMGNLARSALGLTFGDPQAYEGDDAPKPGIVNPMRDPKNSLFTIDFPDVSNNAIQAMSFVKHEVSDMISGMSEPVRGQQTSANQTASSVNQMLEQSNYRMKSMARRGKKFRREYDSIGLLLNQKFLAQTTAYRLNMEDGAWRPVDGNDLFGVAGKDLIPTGFPVEGSNAFFTQQALNEVAVVQQTGGDPAPFMRKYFELKYGGMMDVDNIYPQTGQVGQDPQQENELMAQGMPVKVDPSDDDFRHLFEHQNMILFMIQNQADPQIVNIMMQHFSQHQSRYAQMNPEGQGGGGGGGVGTSGLNTQMPSPDPKEDGEIEAQTNPEGE